MNRITFFKSFAAAALALGTLAAATTAHAGNDVQFSVTLGNPGIHVQSAPVYAQPRPVYVQHRPVYVQPAPVYVQPRPLYVKPAPVYVQPRPIYVQPVHYAQGWGHQRNYKHGYHENAHGHKGDFDRDGIPNRYDRFPGNPNRR